MGRDCLIFDPFHPDKWAPAFPITKKAACKVTPNGNPETEEDGCHGIVKFTQKYRSETLIEWDLKQCGKAGKRGFSIHKWGSVKGNLENAGPNYNPNNSLHGAPEDEERTVGSLGNIEVDGAGNAKGKLVDRQVKLYGWESVMNRSVIISQNEDDLGRGDNSKAAEGGDLQDGYVSKITGNAGQPVAGGRIEKNMLLY